MAGMDESLYEKPRHIGKSPRYPWEFDVALLSAILLRARSPVSILESCARLVSDSIIITEMFCPELGEGPVCSLVPAVGNGTWDT